jgi:hypothetical protein
MSEIFKNTNRKTNIRIFNKFIIVFDISKLIFYSFEGNILNTLKTNIYPNINVLQVKDDTLLLLNDYTLVALIIDDNFEFKNYEICSFNPFCTDAIYLRQNNLLIISYYSPYLEIYKYENLQLTLIQKEQKNISENYLFNFDENIFFLYNSHSISLYQKINGINLFQLASKLKLENIKNILKINYKTLILSDNKYLYLLNIKKMQTKTILLPFSKKPIINPFRGPCCDIFNDLLSSLRKQDSILCNIDNKIYLNENDNLHIFIYHKNNVLFSYSIKNSVNFKSFCDFYIENNYPQLLIKLKLSYLLLGKTIFAVDDKYIQIRQKFNELYCKIQKNKFYTKIRKRKSKEIKKGKKGKKINNSTKYKKNYR